MLRGLILIPSSMCAVSGLSDILCARTSDSQRVFTKVVRPVPDAPCNDETASSVSPSDSPAQSNKLTDNHESELDTLFRILAASATCSHCFRELVLSD